VPDIVPVQGMDFVRRLQPLTGDQAPDHAVEGLDVPVAADRTLAVLLELPGEDRTP